MSVRHHSVIKPLTASHTGQNFLSLLVGTGREFVVNFSLTAEIVNPAIPAFLPPSPDGLQYEADRQAQIREYAESIAHYTLQLWERTSEGTFYRKNFPIFKYFPDHQLDLYPLLWSTTEAGVGDKELLLKFKDGSTLPVAEDNIVVSLDYYTERIDEIWFSVDIPANTEVNFQLPDNYFGYSFKQRLGTQPLKWALIQGAVTSTGYDVLDPSFEEIREDVKDSQIFFACEVSTVVLIKIWS